MSERASKPPSFSVRQHGRQWYVRFSIGGRRHQKPVATIEGTPSGEAKEKAREIVQRAFAQLERAQRGRREQQNPLTLHLRRLSQRSISHQQSSARYEQRLIDFFGPEKDITFITKSDVEAWRDWLSTCSRKDGRSGKLSPKTIREHIMWLASIYNGAGRGVVD